MKRFFHNPDLGLLLIRIGLGAVFIVHGVTKFTGLSGTTVFFGSLGLPAWVAYAVTFVETFGGGAVILGLFTRLSAFGLGVIMVGAIWLVKFSRGFIGGYEFELMLLLMSIGLVFTDGGKYSMDYWIAKKTGQIDAQAKG